MAVVVVVLLLPFPTRSTTRTTHATMTVHGVFVIVCLFGMFWLAWITLSRALKTNLLCVGVDVNWGLEIEEIN